MVFIHVLLSHAVYGKSIVKSTSSVNNFFVLDTVIVPDSLVTDSITAETTKKSESELDAPVDYEAEDSIYYDIKNQVAYLYGNAQVIYGEIQLNAGYIKFDFKNDLIYAKYIEDSTGKMIQKPIFKDGEEEFESRELTYNFKTKKGLIQGVVTEQEGGYIHSERTKKQDDNEVCIHGGKYTTCDHDHPHYYIKLTKAKVIPNDKIVTGPAYLVVEDVPTPLVIPFGFFPNKKGSTSGVLIPEYGEEQNRGFYFRNGGYYFAINDYFDLALTGDIYTNGSWLGHVRSGYKKRYRFNGNVDLRYSQNILGDKGLEDYQKNTMYAVKWRHTQDSKARPNSNFSANVDVSSSAYDRYNSYSIQNRLNTTKQSSITYSTRLPGTPFSFNMNLRHSQNNMDSTINLSLPVAALNMSRIYPLKRRKVVGKERWYEKISMSYTMNTDNKLTVKEENLFEEETLQRFTKGIRHSVPVSASWKIFKHISLSPSVRYNERWYFESINKYWDNDYFNSKDSTFGDVVTDTLSGFNRVYEYSASASLSSRIYGMYTFKNGPVTAIRHVMSPSVSLSYRPDFGREKYNYYSEYFRVTGQDTSFLRYSYFENGMYGTPGAGKSGNVSFSLNNNVEMKVKSKEDSVSNVKKVKLLDALNFSTSYNAIADSLNWSSVNVSARTNILNRFNINFNASLDPYAYKEINDNYHRVNTFEMDETGNLFRLTSANVALNTSFKSQSTASKEKEEKKKDLPGTPDMYVDFDIPWSVRISYSLRYTKPYDEAKTIQTANVTGDINLTPKWKIGFRTGYDFTNKRVTTSSIDIYRDLHCWEMSFHWVPFGNFQSYQFKINVKSAMLKDLKLQRNKSWYDNY